MGQISINVIQSSSKGNCIVLDDSQTYLLLDFGVDNVIWKNSIIHLNLDQNKIAAILLSHYHIDHIRTIECVDENDFYFYSSKATFDFIKNKYNKFIKNSVVLNNSINKWLKIKNSNWKIKAFYTIHNANESLGFIIQNKNKQLVYLTDTKFFINKTLKNKTAYIVESPFGVEYDTSNRNKINIHLNKEQNHLTLKESELLLNAYKGYKTKLFIFSHLNPLTKDFSIIESICKKNNKISVKYIKPNDILKDKFFI